MSFILDALKKSENERQRQAGPSLADVTIVRRKSERPWWAVGVAALLVVNLGVLMIVLMRDGDAKSTAPPAQAAPAPQPQTYSAPAQQPPAQTYQQPAYRQPQPAQSYDPQLATDPSVRSLADEAGAEYDPYANEPPNPSLAGAAAVPEGPPMVRRIEPPSVAPLPSAAVFEARANANGGSVQRSGEVLPTLNDLTASGTNLPELHLDIHVHSQNAGERFVFVNMRKYLEGETLKEGPSVERITADGVILNQRGLRFLLPRQ
ncbi:MAG: general secretion pathway protein GspB [Steroidobacter sp.]